jgi:hypothetical protein
MSEKEVIAGAEAEDPDTSDKALQIKKVVGGYGKSLGLIKGDIIIGLDGDVFLGTTEDFKDYFEIDEDDDLAENPRTVLTIKRDETLFNLICHQRITCNLSESTTPICS